VADQFGSTAVSNLQFCMGASIAAGSPVGSRDDGFFALRLMPAGASRAALEAARPAVYQASDGAQVASPQSLILR
jgi:hypothetical protein